MKLIELISAYIISIDSNDVWLPRVQYALFWTMIRQHLLPYQRKYDSLNKQDYGSDRITNSTITSFGKLIQQRLYLEGVMFILSIACQTGMFADRKNGVGKQVYSKVTVKWN